MLGVEDQREVERLAHRLRGGLAVDHVEEVGGEIQVVARRQRLESLADPLASGDGGRHLGEHPLGLADVGGVVGRRGVDLGVEVGQDAHRRPEHVHRVVTGGDLADQADQRFGQGPRRRDPRPEGVEVRRLGQVAVEQEVGRLEVRDAGGEVLDLVAAILQAAGALLPLDVGDRRFIGDHTLQPRVVNLFRRSAHGGLNSNEVDDQIRTPRPAPAQGRPTRIIHQV